MTVYRRRLASSFLALRKTLERRLKAAVGGRPEALRASDEDISDDEVSDKPAADIEDVEHSEREALGAEETSGIQELLGRIERLPPDSKLGVLGEVLGDLRAAGYAQVMVFTQYTETMDFLREELGRGNLGGAAGVRLMCYSGRGGEVPDASGVWSRIERDEAKRRFRDAEADILLCTEAAAEGLNFQFCGALVNYDMPWNPMRVEQRIGRIDRVGQKHEMIQIVNLHYRDTVETDIYEVLTNRIGLFESVVGRLQPILARLPQTITRAVLEGRGRGPEERAELADEINRQVEEARLSFDIDSVLDDALDAPAEIPSPVTMDDLDRVIGSPGLLPDGTKATPLGPREYKMEGPAWTRQ